MALWGAIIKPKERYVHHYNAEKGRFRLCVATLGSDLSEGKATLVCSVGKNNPLRLCRLLPDRIESLNLGIEFEEEDDVIFSVEGPHTIHLSGFFLGEKPAKTKDIVDDETPAKQRVVDSGETRKRKKEDCDDIAIEVNVKKTKKGKDLQEGDAKNKEQTSKKVVKLTVVKPVRSTTFPSGLVIEELKEPNKDGQIASPGKTVSVLYVGKLEDGTVFDSSDGKETLNFCLGGGKVIKGCDIGISGMRVGDKRRLIIPPAMGFGAKGEDKIPPNSWLLFEVELVGMD